MAKKPVVLIIRDGWGINPGGYYTEKKDGNTTFLADTPFHDTLYATYPMSRISASGKVVGLPKGQMGNSEVGHMNLGAGRIVYQDLTRINKEIEENKFSQNKVLIKNLEKIKNDNKSLHLIGLISDGGVHSHHNHMIELAKIAKSKNIKNIFVHAITDGRDTSPTGGEKYISHCEDELAKLGVKIITVVGRYFAMDRDNRWERTQKAWDAIVSGIGESSLLLPSEAIKEAYKNENTDEFLNPIVFDQNKQQRIKDGDTVLFFNFRADRARQICRAFLEKDFSDFKKQDSPKINLVTMTEYQSDFDCEILFKPEKYKNCLGEVVANANLKQLRIAETEKYPHVTYFFNVGIEKPFKNEDRHIISSPKVATYDLQPEMSAYEVTQKAIDLIDKKDLVILNFANPDMVGHTGSVDAAIKAVESVDECLERIVAKVLELDGCLLITADHGNCEFMVNNDGSPHTAHTTNLVHLIYVGKDHESIELDNGILADIAPSILNLLDIEKPIEMTGKNLVKKWSS